MEFDVFFLKEVIDKKDEDMFSKVLNLMKNGENINVFYKSGGGFFYYVVLKYNGYKDVLWFILVVF